MHIKIYVQNKEKLKDLTTKNLQSQTFDELQKSIEKKELFVHNVPFFSVSIHKNENIKIAFIAFEDNNIVALLLLEWSEKPFHSLTKCHWYLQNIGVAREFQGKGLSNFLISTMFNTFDDLGLSGIYQSNYSHEGWQRTMHIFSRESKKHPHVRFIDGKRRFE